MKNKILLAFVICLFGVYIGKKSQTILTKYADLVGGIILILIGLEIICNISFRYCCF